MSAQVRRSTGLLDTAEARERIAATLPPEHAPEDVDHVVWLLELYVDSKPGKFSVLDRKARRADLRRVHAAAVELLSALEALGPGACSCLLDLMVHYDLEQRKGGEYRLNYLPLVGVVPTGLEAVAKAAGSYRPRGRQPMTARRELLFQLAHLYRNCGGNVGLSGCGAGRGGHTLAPGPFERFIGAALDLLPAERRFNTARTLRVVVDRMRSERG